MRYLQSTIDVGLTFNGSGNEDVVDVFSDADCANGVNMKSVSFIFPFFSSKYPLRLLFRINKFGRQCNETPVGCPACYEIPAEYD